MAKVLRTTLCEQLGISYPILLAAMGSKGKATPAELVAAVSNAGGMGFIGGSNLSADEIRQIIRRVRALTDKPFGIGLLLPAKLAEAPKTRAEVRRELVEKFPKHAEFARKIMSDHGLPDVVVERQTVTSNQAIEEQIEVVFEEKVAAFAAGLGDPSRLVSRARQVGMKVFGLAGSVANAKRQKAAGVDFVIAQGYEAGGHTGRVANFPLVPQVVDAVSPTPVVAAGGISDGRGIAAAIALGATGVWLGTRFLVADECAIADAMKDQIVGSRSEDFEITRFNTGKSQRTYTNEVLKAWERSGLGPLPFPYQGVLMTDFDEAAARAGRWDLHSNPGGQGAALIKKRQPARQIVEELVAGTIEALEQSRAQVSYSR